RPCEVCRNNQAERLFMPGRTLEICVTHGFGNDTNVMTPGKDVTDDLVVKCEMIGHRQSRIELLLTKNEGIQHKADTSRRGDTALAAIKTVIIQGVTELLVFGK